MLRIRAAAGVLASLGLATAMVVPVHAEPAPPTLSIETQVSHYLGGWWEQQIGFTITCDGYGSVENVVVDLPGATDGNVLDPLGPLPAATHCWIEVSSYPNAGDNAGWNEATFDPDSEFWLTDGDTHVTVSIARTWAQEWPPQDDVWSEHLLATTVDRVYLNSKGGIEVEGTSWCPEAADVLPLGSDGAYANAGWSALQYVGRRTAIHAQYESAIAHPCFEPAAPNHGPYRWETRYAYPSGALLFIYGSDGKFGAGSIHVEAFVGMELVGIAQNFAPGGWTSFEGEYVPYDAACQDNDGDGWCVTRHLWSGWAQADLKPIKVR